MGAVEIARAYHERTKHRLGGYARGPEYLNWEDQPDPFRLFAGAPMRPLPLLPDPLNAAHPTALDLDGVSKLLELSMGLSAWKQFGPDRWALRCNPSSGNLHPTEAYVVSNRVPGLADGVHHYAPREHALEQRAALAGDPEHGWCLLGLSSIHWREAWKYGERAFRYVQLDVGHALGAIRYAAAVLGWSLTLLPLEDKRVAQLLGLDRAEDFANAEVEHPDLLLQLCAESTVQPSAWPDTTDWCGKANHLAGDPYLKWPVLNEVQTACECRMPLGVPAPEGHGVATPEPLTLTRLIRQRRSAQSFIGKQGTMKLADFARLLRAILPERSALPWDVWPLSARLHLVLFVHRVDDLAPGLYALPRNIGGRLLMQSAMNPEFEWLPMESLLEGIPLFRLQSGDLRKVARSLSCHQEIASASSFSLAMLAEYDDALKSQACTYRQLHWEAGLLGQVLYLEAEAVGMRGTGIGCFFDDSVHLTLGMHQSDRRLQVVYHFTVGYPRLDPRLETLPPYQHLDRSPSE